MIEYLLNGAWGKTVPDEELLKKLADFGVELTVEARHDGLSKVAIRIDDEKILRKKTRAAGRRAKSTGAEDKASKNTKKTAVKKASK